MTAHTCSLAIDHTGPATVVSATSPTRADIFLGFRLVRLDAWLYPDTVGCTSAAGSGELRRLAAAARARVIAGGSIEDSMLRVERTEGAVPDGAADLVADLYRRMPDARITDILLEVDDATRFTEAFTHLRTGSPCRDRIGLLNVLLAEGINLGLRKMAEATTTHGFWELMRIARWHVEGEAYEGYRHHPCRNTR